MRVDLFDYDLPEGLIASRPPAERDGGRLMVLRARDAAPLHAHIADLPELLPPRALLVANDTRVIPARLCGHKPTGGKVEVLLVERVREDGDRKQTWRALARASKGVSTGLSFEVEAAGARSDEQRASRVLGCEIVAAPPGAGAEPGTVLVRLTSAEGTTVNEAIEACGHVPLPPYVRRPDDADDRDRYQTLLAKHPGAVAAPTAGLHLSTRILDALRAREIEIACVTLHVSLGTFQPVKVADLDDHAMHAETFVVGSGVAGAIAAARERGSPVIAIGTTAVRALESAADPERPGLVAETAGSTRILIQPGYEFRVVDGLLTNFHLPRSTLLALVSAFAGRERILDAYRVAVEERYRFFSYGDAMLLMPRAST